jgi:phage gpG-like protein
MTPEEGIKKLAAQVKGALLRAPLLAGNEAVNFALDNFKRQGFMGNTFMPWQSRKVGWKKDKRKGRSLLVDTGRLKRSIRITKLNKDSVTIGSDVKYAKAHNEGASITVVQSVKGFTRKNGSNVKAHSRRVNIRIPKRQFIGNSPFLEARIKKVISEILNLKS